MLFMNKKSLLMNVILQCAGYVQQNCRKYNKNKQTTGIAHSKIILDEYILKNNLFLNDFSS